MSEIDRCYNKVQTITEILFLLFTSIPQAHEINHSDITKSSIYSSVLCTFNFAVLLENSYLP